MGGGEQPVAAEEQELDAVSSHSRRHKRLQRLCVITAALCLVAAVALVATAHESDDGGPVRAMGSGGTDIDSTTSVDPVAETTTTTSVEATTTTAPAAPAEAAAEGGAASPPVTSTGLLRQSAPAFLDPYEWLTVASVDPCPPGTDLVDLTVNGVGGTMFGLAAGRDQVPVGADGHWSAALVIRAVGGIDNVDVAMTAPELDVRTRCQSGSLWGARNVDTASYATIRVTQRPVTVVPELTATWDGHTISLELSGCPTHAFGGLHVGDAPLGPPSGEDRDLMVGVNDDEATRGQEPGSWTQTIEISDYDAADGLWAYGFCTVDSEFATIIWRSLPFELDPPG